jgi:hypothetical protein
MVLFFIAITVSFVSSTAFAVQGVADRARLTSPFKGWRTERVLQGRSRGGGPSASYKTGKSIVKALLFLLVL